MYASPGYRPGELRYRARLEVHLETGSQATPERFPQSWYLPITECCQQEARKPDTRGGTSPSWLESCMEAEPSRERA
jgi:hypothetical protein